jgi:hypothetical protein
MTYNLRTAEEILVYEPRAITTMWYCNQTRPVRPEEFEGLHSTVHLILVKIKTLFPATVDIEVDDKPSRTYAKTFYIRRRDSKFYTAMLHCNKGDHKVLLYSPYLWFDGTRKRRNRDWIGTLENNAFNYWSTSVTATFGLDTKSCFNQTVAIIKKLIKIEQGALEEEHLIRAIAESNKGTIEDLKPESVSTKLRDNIGKRFLAKSLYSSSNLVHFGADFAYAAFLALEAAVNGLPQPTVNASVVSALQTVSPDIAALREEIDLNRGAVPIRLFKLSNQNHVYAQNIMVDAIPRRVDTLDDFNPAFLAKVATLMALGKGSIPAVGTCLEPDLNVFSFAEGKGYMELDMVVMFDGELYEK